MLYTKNFVYGNIVKILFRIKKRLLQMMRIRVKMTHDEDWTQKFPVFIWNKMYINGIVILEIKKHPHSCEC